MKRAQRHTSEAGMTLVELMIAVAIVAVLTAMGVWGYSKYIRNARVVEAREFMGRIQMAQETYFERAGYYCNVNASTWYPTPVTGFEPMTWDPTSSTISSWSSCIGSRVAPEGNQTYFSYIVAAGTSGLTSDASSVMGMSYANAPWYYIRAQADMDGKGTPNTELRVTSQRRKVWILNEGQ